MKTLIRRSVAALELLLIFPAALFMAALFVRNLQPQQYEPAHSAEQIVEWYAARPHVGLWILMIALPLFVTLAGCMVLVRAWRRDEALRDAARTVWANVRAHFASFVILMTTVLAGGILAIVALHLITN